jgi:hypothetical protein
MTCLGEKCNIQNALANDLIGIILRRITEVS